ncbi:MAG TPA: hypothetical protein VFM94_11235, partial [Solirubrobacterales bacterium]|nr:hypothetical protein [Solirubrobacterales bacterium]
TGKWGTETLTGSVSGDPHAMVDPTNKTVHVFYRTPSGTLGHNWYTPGKSTSWGSETLSASVAGEPYLMADAKGGLNVFYRTSSSSLGHTWWEATTGKWGSETLAGSLDTSETMGIHGVAQSNGASDIFYRTASGGLGHNWYVQSSGWGNEVLSGSL